MDNLILFQYAEIGVRWGPGESEGFAGSFVVLNFTYLIVYDSYRTINYIVTLRKHVGRHLVTWPMFFRYWGTDLCSADVGKNGHIPRNSVQTVWETLQGGIIL